MATKKPCPGCGVVDRYRKATEVCDQCARDISDGQVFREYFGKKKHNAEIRSVPEVAHWFPYIQDGEEFKVIFHTLVGLISIPSRTKNSKSLIPGQDGGYDNTETSRIFPQGVSALLAELYEAIREIARRCHVDGRKTMLHSLAHIKDDTKEFIKLLEEAEKSHDPDNRKRKGTT